MADELEPLHAAAIDALASKLKNSPAVTALVPEQVFGPTEQDAAKEWARCVLVTAGRRRDPAGNHAGRMLVQRDAKIEMRAENQAVLDMLASAVVRAINGAVGGSAFQHCVLTNTPPSEDGPGEPPAYRVRVDTYGLHCVRPASAVEPAAPAVPPPARVSLKAPVSAPPKLKKE